MAWALIWRQRTWLFCTILTSIPITIDKQKTGAIEWDRPSTILAANCLLFRKPNYSGFLCYLSNGKRQVWCKVTFRDVTVVKLITKGTVEEKMLECAMTKLKLEKDVTGKDRGIFILFDLYLSTSTYLLSFFYLVPSVRGKTTSRNKALAKKTADLKNLNLNI